VSQAKRRADVTTTLKQAGGSLTVTVPARFRHELGLSAGMVMSVGVEDGKLTLQPARKPRRAYKLADLLAEEKAAGIAPLDTIDHDWVDATPKGREIW